MKRIFLNCCLIIMFAALGAKAQTVKRNFLQKYVQADVARLLAPPGQWKPFPTMPEGWRKALPDSIVHELIRNGEEALTQEFKPIPASLTLEFVRSGNRVRYEKQSFIKRDLLIDLVLAESVEGKGRFTDHILDGVWSVCEESFWGIPAHLPMQKAGKGLPDVADPIVDLFASETAAVLALTDYFVGEKLAAISPLVRPRIYAEVDRRIFKPMPAAKYEYMGYGNPDTKVNNWAPWIMSNYIASLLLLEKDTQKRAEGIKLAMKYTDQYLNSLGNDASCDEGPVYWFAAGAAAFDALNLLYDCSDGKISIFKEPFIQKMGAYVYKTHIAGRNFVNIADAVPQITPDGFMLYRFGKATADGTMMGFGSWAAHEFSYNYRATHEQFFRTRRLYDLMVMQECKTYPAKYTPVNDAWMSDIQLMTSRSGHFFVATHGGHNAESHNHNDVGDLMIYADNQPLIIDAGAGTYTARTFSNQRYSLWFNTSAYHNLPTVNNIQQKDGAIYKATDVAYKNNKAASALSMNLASAYPQEGGVRSWVRNVTLSKAGGLTITDQYQLAKPINHITQTFMTVCGVDVETPGKLVFTLENGKKAFLKYNAAHWKATKEKIGLNLPEDEKFKLSWHNKDIWRVLLSNTQAGADGKLIYEIGLEK